MNSGVKLIFWASQRVIICIRVNWTATLQPFLGLRCKKLIISLVVSTQPQWKTVPTGIRKDKERVYKTGRKCAPKVTDWLRYFRSCLYKWLFCPEHVSLSL